MNRIILLILMIVILGLGSCATIITGDTQILKIDSEPQGVEVYIDGKLLGETPVSVAVKKQRTSQIVLKKKGYHTHSEVLNTSINPWFWGNILIGGLLGSTTDGLTDSIFEYDPSAYYFHLKADQPESKAESRLLKTKDFMIHSYHQLQADINAGGGRYLAGLFSLLAVSPEKKDQALEVIRQIGADQKNAVHFADAVIKQLG